MRTALDSAPVVPSGTAPCDSIALVISSLGPGGAERVMSRLANHWAGLGVRVVVITFQAETADHFPLHGAVERIRLGTARPSSGFLRAMINNREHVKRLTQALRGSDPQVVLSFGDTTNVLSIAAARTLRIPVIVSERSNPTRAAMRGVWSVLRRVAYPAATSVVVQSRPVANWAAGIVDPARIWTIPNPVEAQPISAADEDVESTAMVDENTIIAVGRMSREKGFDLLISAFADVRRKHPDWRLVILGDGTERLRLEAQIRDLGVETAVHMPGTVAAPAAFLRRAGIFVLPSRTEGFPNALLEAMASGLPVVAADCAYGPAEIVRSGSNGLLVESERPDAIAAAVCRLIEEPDLRAALATEATTVEEEFSVEKIMGQWDTLVRAASPRGNAGGE